MAQAGYTPIQLYYSTTAAAVPLAANLAQGELAINIADGKLYYENSSGVVTLLASSTTVTNSFSAGTTGFTPSTATTGAVTLGGTLITSNGGTGLASYTAGDLSYYASGTALTKLAIGTAGQILTSSGTAPQWSTLSGVAVTTFSAGTTGFTPSSATAGAVTLAGTLATTNGGTGLTSFTSGGVVYASSTSALATGSALTFDGSTFGVTGATTVTGDISTTSTGRLNLRGSGTGVNYDFQLDNDDSLAYFRASRSNAVTKGYAWFLNNSTSEGMRLTSTGLGIGTSSPSAKLDVAGNANIKQFVSAGNGTTDGYLGYSWNRNLASGALFDNAKNAYDFLMQPGSNNLFLEIYAPGGGVVTGNALVMTPTGNLGLGVTPSAWDSVWKATQIGSTGFIAGRTNAERFYAGSNAYFNGTNWIYVTTGRATYYASNLSQHEWYTAGSGTAGDTIAFTTAMTLDASGNLGVGTTSPAAPVHASLSGSSNVARFASTTDGSPWINWFTNGVERLRLTYSSVECNLYTLPAIALVFGTSNTERARIDSDGYFYLRTTTRRSSAVFSLDSTTGTTNGMGLFASGTASSGMIVFSNPNGAVGSIDINGSATTYSTSSDYRLKNTIAPMTGALAKVALLKPCTYKWNADGSDGEGFIAHELAEVCPNAVTGEKDAVDAEGNIKSQGIDTSFLVATLTAAIQEQQAIIESLKARLDAANL